jgi:osmotically-inducible protein OsmY
VPTPARVEQPFRQPLDFDVQEFQTPSVQPAPQPLSEPAPEIWFRSPGSQRPSRANPSMGGAVRANVPRTQTAAPQMSIGMEIGFQPAAAPTAQVSTALSSRISQMAGDRIDEPVTVTISGGQATLRGAVKSPYDRIVIGAMALMEPGVRQVRNELTIEPQTALAGPSSSTTGQ